MKSKSFTTFKKGSEKVQQNKTFDFIKFYKCAAETNVQLLNIKKTDDDGSRSSSNTKNKNTPKRERLSHKISKNKSDTSKNIGVNLSSAEENSLLNISKVTSTPNIPKNDTKKKVKSIIKDKQLLDETLDISDNSVSSSKPKKRNKSVSFMLDESEEVAFKRSKSEETVAATEYVKLEIKNLAKTKKPKKNKKKFQSEKENRGDANNTAIGTVPLQSEKTQVKHNKNLESEAYVPVNTEPVKDVNIKRKHKHKKSKAMDNVETDVDCAFKTEETDVAKTVNNDDIKNNINKKVKSKKKRSDVRLAITSVKKDKSLVKSANDIKPDVIVQDLENLNIGDNAHTLTNLLDDMTVVDKNKKRRQKNKDKNKHKQNKELDINEECKGENDNPEEKEKVKWVKRKWNKDKKGEVNVDKYLTSIVIENLPLKIMCSYKKLLSEHFQKFGMITNVGIAEMYPIEEPKPVFTTTINFYSEDAADKALEEDNTVFEGNRIRIKKPLPPTLTTLVVRSYAELTEQILSSVFTGAGRIRNIRHLMKGKKALSTAFIEFDGPESVERAIKMAEEAKVGGKKLHVAKFELRNKNKKMRKNDD